MLSFRLLAKIKQIQICTQIEAKRYGEVFVKKVLKIGVGFAGKAIALAKGAGL